MEAHPHPNLEIIEDELAAYRKWWAAYQQKVKPLPELPTRDNENMSNVALIGGNALRIGYWWIGWLARRFRLSSLRVWAAQKVIAFDGFLLEPASCSLNNALTELGLALLETGDRMAAINCLRRSWKVHPCPHNIWFGLKTRLWQALSSVEESVEARDEYQEMARKFRLGAAWPPPRQNLTFRQKVTSVLRAFPSLRK